MKKIKDIAIYVLIGAVSILTLVSILSIWKVLSDDALWKSISTIGVVAFGALIVVIASQVLENKSVFTSENNTTPKV